MVMPRSTPSLSMTKVPRFAYPVSPMNTPYFCETFPLGWKSESSVALKASSRLKALRLHLLSTETPITDAFSRW